MFLVSKSLPSGQRAGTVGTGNSPHKGRPEKVARQARRREATGVVVARAFDQPPATAECGSTLVCPGGIMVISDPPAPSAGTPAPEPRSSTESGRWRHHDSSPWFLSL